MKQAIALLFALMLCVGVATAQETTAPRPFFELIGSWFKSPFTVHGNQASLGVCQSGFGSDSSVQIDIDDWQYDPNRPEYGYVYFRGQVTKTAYFEKVKIVPYKSHRGRIAYGGKDFDRLLVTTSPATDEQIRSCIPEWQGGSTAPAPTTSDLSCGTKGNLQIIDVAYNKEAARTGQPLAITVTVKNDGLGRVSSENIECGIYPSDSPYIKNTFPRANFLALLSKPVASCVPDEDPYVKAVEVLDIGPGETKLLSIAPTIAPNIVDKGTVVCGIYPTSQCGEYVNACGDKRGFDDR